MKRVEQYIKEHTNRYSNHVSLAPYITGFTEWLTIDDARRVAKIAREEIMDEVCDYIKNNLYKHLYVYDGHAGFPTHQFINDLKQAMKDE